MRINPHMRSRDLLSSTEHQLPLSSSTTTEGPYSWAKNRKKVCPIVSNDIFHFG